MSTQILQRMKTTYLVPALLIFSGILTVGCAEDPPPSLFDPGATGGAQPVITSIVSPTPNALAGVTVVMINGQNFSPVPENNLVFFDTLRAAVQSASTTQISVLAPAVDNPRDSVRVKIAVLGAALFSDVFYMKLVPPITRPDSLGIGEEPTGMTVDRLGNLYVSLLPSPSGPNVVQYTPSGVRTQYSPPFPSASRSYSGMKMGPGDTLYVAQRQARILRVFPGGGTAVTWIAGGGLGAIADFDFDQQGNLWCGGSASSVYRVTPLKSIRAFPFVANVRSVRVYSGNLYVGGAMDSIEGVWRFPIVSADSLGPVQLFYDFTQDRPGAGKVNAITFSDDGDMFVGVDEQLSLILVHPSGSSERFYPGLFKFQNTALAYGTGTELYASRRDTTTGSGPAHAILRIETQKQRAPYHGRGD